MDLEKVQSGVGGRGDDTVFNPTFIPVSPIVSIDPSSLLTIARSASKPSQLLVMVNNRGNARTLTPACRQKITRHSNSGLYVAENAPYNRR